MENIIVLNNEEINSVSGGFSIMGAVSSFAFVVWNLNRLIYDAGTKAILTEQHKVTDKSAEGGMVQHDYSHTVDKTFLLKESIILSVGIIVIYNLADYALYGLYMTYKGASWLVSKIVT